MLFLFQVCQRLSQPNWQSTLQVSTLYVLKPLNNIQQTVFSGTTFYIFKVSYTSSTVFTLKTGKKGIFLVESPVTLTMTILTDQISVIQQGLDTFDNYHSVLYLLLSQALTMVDSWNFWSPLTFVAHGERGVHRRHKG